MAAAKVSKHQQTGAARPSDTLRDDDEALHVSRVGRVIMRVPKRLSYEAALAAAGAFRGALQRSQEKDQERLPR